MTNKALSIFNQLRPVTIGFDNVFNQFERMFDHQFDSISVPNFPPYNIVKTGDNKYDVEVKGAELKDGLLKVSLERIIPESRKAKTISIK